jgi:hypothetical protein
MIDIKEVGAIGANIDTLEIEALAKNGFRLWIHRYPTREAFEAALDIILVKFDEEIKRREREANE